ncbi:alpha-galactosidase [Pedobacter sp. MC2016-14]|uniref:glycoside hydrolase family 36 protein n=1 Tax=Pedobacter sp. MC2016-14 TaxID=2897327 RepID=UPI001E4DF66A|nr:glycoside hydrolase family 36 protein [Pedobacter sp. MC2016-14]MCD0490342.1 alpha-galactosidase [Pedobacter sp. MC2016-14]
MTTYKSIFLLVLLVIVTKQTVSAQVRSPGQEFETPDYNFYLNGDLKAFRAGFSTKSDASGVEYLILKLKSDRKITPAPLILKWSIPIVDIQGVWTPGRNFNKYLYPTWSPNNFFLSGATTNAPVTTLYNLNNKNRLTFACSDALNFLRIGSGVNEVTTMIDCELKLFTEPQPDISSYELVIRLDKRDVPYWVSLADVSKWWAEIPAYKPNLSPEAARLPMYSTWYSFHQQLTTKDVEEQCRLSKAMGCETVIVDDGWQTLDSSLGYAYTGDWNPDRIPDMKAHVARVHQLGMKYMLWYSVPFVGEKSKVYPQFKGKYLYYKKRWAAYALDPRFPEVRQYMIDKYIKALKDWDIDGFKLDFVDSFVPDEGTVQQASEGRDFASINDAVDKLLTDVMVSLRAIKPDILIEFRQSYIGPMMRKYGNMFRAGDSPNDALSNRLRTIDLRLLSGNTAVHSDMLMWHKDEKVEVAALQFLNILFSVPQISVKLDEIPLAHREMLVFWLAFWKTNRAVILDGDFRPSQPDLNYPLVTAMNAQQELVAVYAPGTVVKITGKMVKQVSIVNANYGKELILDLNADAGIRELVIRDCRGKQVKIQKINLAKGLHKFEVPPSGLLQVSSY